MDYFHADRLNYAVVGTPNRLEYDQGFFVKVGDGAADIKPIAHLYKSQVNAMARAHGLPNDICGAQPTTDTYTLNRGQDEFYFVLPYAQMDIALWSLNHGVSAADLSAALGLRDALARHVYVDIEAKRHAARYFHAPAETIEPITPSANGMFVPQVVSFRSRLCLVRLRLDCRP
jgi:NAD+ synthase